MSPRTTKAELEAEISRLQAVIKEQARQIDELRTVGMTSEARQKMQMELNAAYANEKTLNWHIERLEKENEALRNALTAAHQESKKTPAARGRKSAISAETRAAIKARADDGQSLRDIAKDMGISKSTIHRILNE